MILAGCETISPTQQYQIASSSMFPTLPGPSLLGSCRYCQSTIVVAAESFVNSVPTRCYACGGICEVNDQRLPGATVGLLPFPDTKGPERFDVVAFLSHEDNQLRTKRVWGLPGEQVTIRAGKLWIDGHPLHRTLRDFERLSIPLDSFVDPKRNVSHWFALEKAKGSSPRTIEPTNDQDPAVVLRAGDEVAWNFLRPAPVHPDETFPEAWLLKSDINDDDSWNQGLSFQTQRVDDYLLKIEFAPQSESSLLVRCRYLNKLFCLQVHVRPTVATSTEELHKALPPGAREGEAFRIVCNDRILLAFCDGQALLRVDGLEHAWSSDASGISLLEAAHEQHHVALECTMGAVALRRLEVSRDVYIRTTNRDGAGEQQFDKLPKDSYFVMGDNIPASVDSRNKLGFISRRQIRGSVVLTGQANGSPER